MYGSASGEIKRRQGEKPSAWVPRPTCDWAVDDGSPKEAEDQRRDDTPTLERAADHDHDCASTEHELIQAEHNLGDRSTNGRCSEDVSQAKVGKITDERSRCSGKSEAVTPEHPLEGTDGHDKDGLEQHGQGRLSSRESSIEETNARYNEKDKERLDNHVHIVEFDTGPLIIHVNFLRIAAIGRTGIECWLQEKVR